MLASSQLCSKPQSLHILSLSREITVQLRAIQDVWSLNLLCAPAFLFLTNNEREVSELKLISLRDAINKPIPAVHLRYWVALCDVLAFALSPAPASRAREPLCVRGCRGLDAGRGWTATTDMLCYSCTQKTCLSRIFVGKEVQPLENERCQGQTKVALSACNMELSICRGNYYIVVWVSLDLWVGRSAWTSQSPCCQ